MSIQIKAGFALLAVTLVSGCAQAPAPRAQDSASEGAAITQVGYGPYAKYVTCPISGCARPTTKTVSEPQATDASPRPTSAVPVVPAAPSAITEPEEKAAVLPTASVAAVPPQAQPLAATGVPGKVFVKFPSRSARLTDEAKKQLDQLVPYVQGSAQVVIKGRTDGDGGPESNDRLAMRRAVAVYEHLRRAAKASDKSFKLLAKGACCYVAPNDTEDGRAANRRAEIDFVPPMQASVTATRRAPSKAHPS